MKDVTKSLGLYSPKPAASDVRIIIPRGLAWGYSLTGSRVRLSELLIRLHVVAEKYRDPPGIFLGIQSDLDDHGQGD